MKIEAKVEQFRATLDHESRYYTGLSVNVTYWDDKVEAIPLVMPSNFYHILLRKGIDPTAFFKIIEEKINASPSVLQSAQEVPISDGQGN